MDKADSTPNQQITEAKAGNDLSKNVLADTRFANYKSEQETGTQKAPTENIEKDFKKDGNGGNQRETEDLKTSSSQSIQIEYGENRKSESQIDSYIEITELTDANEIGEVKNEMLFSSPKGRMENIESMTKAQDSQQQKLDSHTETEYPRPLAKKSRGHSKFWQTPKEHASSPFTPVENQLQPRWEGKDTEETIVKDLQYFLNKDLESTMDVAFPESQDKYLEQLSEELIQVFNYDNIHRSTTSQKEALVQKIIKLGGEDYIAEDLRRDILKIEMEDILLKQDK